MSQKHIFLINEDANIQKLLNISLIKAGNKVTTVKNGMNLLKKLELLKESSEPIDLLILNINKNKISSLELIDNLRQRKLDFPIIVTNNDSDEQTTNKDISKKNVYFLKNPFIMSDFIKQIEYILREFSSEQIEDTQNLNSTKNNYENAEGKIWHTLQNNKISLVYKKNLPEKPYNFFFDMDTSSTRSDILAAELIKSDSNHPCYMEIINDLFQSNFKKNISCLSFFEILNTKFLDNDLAKFLSKISLIRFDFKTDRSEIVSTIPLDIVKINSKLPTPISLYEKEIFLNNQRLFLFSFSIKRCYRFFIHNLKPLSFNLPGNLDQFSYYDTVYGTIEKYRYLTLKEILTQMWKNLNLTCNDQSCMNLMLFGIESSKKEALVLN
ncbi:MAG: response regulator [Promethearchaeota archaeon]